MGEDSLLHEVEKLCSIAKPYLGVIDQKRVSQIVNRIVDLLKELHDLRTTQEIVQREADRFMTAVTHTPAIVFALDREGKFILSEGRGLSTLGLRPGQIVGRSVFEIYNDVPWIIESIQKAYQSGEITHASGEVSELWYDAQYTPIRDQTGTVVRLVGVAIDITKQKLEEKKRLHLFESEQALRKKCENTSEKLKNETAIREQFISTLSHDLRTPLTSVQTCAETLYNQPDQAELVKRLSRRIFEDSHRMDRMISGLLDGARIQSGQRLNLGIQKLDFSRLIVETIESMSIIYGNRFRFENSELICGYSSYDGLQRVIENLLSNAVKYGDPMAMITVGLAASGENIQIFVHNKGAPIPIKQQTKIFEPFQQEFSNEFNSKNKGWGLGLTLVKNMVEILGGYVKLESSPGNGTTFTVIVPRDSRNFKAA